MNYISRFNGYGADGRRLYHKGGGDGGAGEMRRQEQERQLRVKDATTRVNDIFTGGPAHKRGVNLITDPSGVNQAQGGTYYDAQGNPVVVPSADQYRAQHPGGGSHGGHALDLVARTDVPDFVSRGLYSGVEDVPDTQGFTDDYFNNIADAYVKFQQPMFEEQIAKARRELPYQFASTDNSEYQRRAAELERDAGREGANIRDQGIDFANKQRGQVESNRSDLVSLATSGADANTIAQMAATRAGALTKPPVFTPIADLFQKYTAAAANASLANPYAQFPGGVNNSLLFQRRSPMLSTDNSDAVREIA